MFLNVIDLKTMAASIKFPFSIHIKIIVFLGLFQYNSMIFGLCYSPAKYQRFNGVYRMKVCDLYRWSISRWYIFSHNLKRELRNCLTALSFWWCLYYQYIIVKVLLHCYFSKQIMYYTFFFLSVSTILYIYFYIIWLFL